MRSAAAPAIPAQGLLLTPDSVQGHGSHCSRSLGQVHEVQPQEPQVAEPRPIRPVVSAFAQPLGGETEKEKNPAQNRETDTRFCPIQQRPRLHAPVCAPPPVRLCPDHR